VFDPAESGIIDTLYVRLTWQDQIDAGRTVSEHTIRWWLQQDDAARQALEGESVSLRGALVALTKFYIARDCGRLWANGPSFDVSILDHAFAHDGMLTAPWKYNAARDMRTIRDLVPPDFGDDIPLATAHNALDDAVWQARYVRAALCYLNPAPISLPGVT
jgi:hypothetical protein